MMTCQGQIVPLPTSWNRLDIDEACPVKPAWMNDSGLTRSETIMTGELSLDNQSGAIFLMCLFYAIHMVEEFFFGFVPWADRYFGRFDRKQHPECPTFFHSGLLSLEVR
jgi:hypothetical protein